MTRVLTESALRRLCAEHVQAIRNELDLALASLPSSSSSPTQQGGDATTEAWTKLRSALNERVALAVLERILRTALSAIRAEEPEEEKMPSDSAAHYASLCSLSTSYPEQWSSYAQKAFAQRLQSAIDATSSLENESKQAVDGSEVFKLLLSDAYSSQSSQAALPRLSISDLLSGSSAPRTGKRDLSCGILFLQALSCVDASVAMGLAGIALALPRPATLVELLGVWLESWLSLPLLCEPESLFPELSGEKSMQLQQLQSRIIPVLFEGMCVMTHPDEYLGQKSQDNHCFPLYALISVFVQERTRILDLASQVASGKQSIADTVTPSDCSVLGNTVFAMAELNALLEVLNAQDQEEHQPEDGKTDASVPFVAKHVTDCIDPSFVLRSLLQIPFFAFGLCDDQQPEVLMILHRAVLVREQVPLPLRSQIASAYPKAGDTMKEGSSSYTTLASLLDSFPSNLLPLDAVIEVVATTPSQSLPHILPQSLHKFVNQGGMNSFYSPAFWTHTEAIPSVWQWSSVFSSATDGQVHWMAWSARLTQFMFQALGYLNDESRSSNSVVQLVSRFNREEATRALRLGVTAHSSTSVAIRESEKVSQITPTSLSTLIYTTFALAVAQEWASDSKAITSGYTFPMFLPALSADQAAGESNFDAALVVVATVANSPLCNWLLPPLYREHKGLSAALAQAPLLLATLHKLASAIYPRAVPNVREEQLLVTEDDDHPGYFVESSLQTSTHSQQDKPRVLRPLVPLTPVLFIDTRPIAQFLDLRLPGSVHVEVSQLITALVAVHKALIISKPANHIQSLRSSACSLVTSDVYSGIFETLTRRVKGEHLGVKEGRALKFPAFLISHLCFLSALQSLVARYNGVYICIIYDKAPNGTSTFGGNSSDANDVQRAALLDSLPLAYLYHLATTGQGAMLPEQFIQHWNQSEQEAPLMALPSWLGRGESQAHILASWLSTAPLMGGNKIAGPRIHVSAASFSTICSQLPTPSLLVRGPPKPIEMARQEALETQKKLEKDAKSVMQAVKRFAARMERGSEEQSEVPQVNLSPKITTECKNQAILTAMNAVQTLAVAIQKLRSWHKQAVGIDEVSLETLKKETVTAISQRVTAFLNTVSLEHASESLTVVSTVLAAAIGQRLRRLLIQIETTFSEKPPNVLVDASRPTSSAEAGSPGQPESKGQHGKGIATAAAHASHELSTPKVSLMDKLRTKAREFKTRIQAEFRKNEETHETNDANTSNPSTTALQTDVASLQAVVMYSLAFSSIPEVQGSLKLAESPSDPNVVNGEDGSSQPPIFDTADEDAPWARQFLALALLTSRQHCNPSAASSLLTRATSEVNFEIGMNHGSNSDSSESADSPSARNREIKCKLRITTCSVPCIVRSRKVDGTPGTKGTRVGSGRAYDVLIASSVTASQTDESSVGTDNTKPSVQLQWSKLPTNAADNHPKVRVEPLRSLTLADLQSVLRSSSDDASSLPGSQHKIAVRLASIDLGSLSRSADVSERSVAQWLLRHSQGDPQITFVLPASVLRPSHNQASVPDADLPKSPLVQAAKRMQSDPIIEHTSLGSGPVSGPVFVVDDEDDTSRQATPRLVSSPDGPQSGRKARSRSRSRSRGRRSMGGLGLTAMSAASQFLGSDASQPNADECAAEEDDDEIGHFRYGGRDSDSEVENEHTSDEDSGELKLPWKQSPTGDQIAPQALPSARATQKDDSLEDIAMYDDVPFEEDDDDDLYAQHLRLQRDGTASSAAGDEVTAERIAELQADLAAQFNLVQSTSSSAIQSCSPLLQASQSAPQIGMGFDSANAWSNENLIPLEKLVSPSAIGFTSESDSDDDALYFEALAEFRLVVVPSEVKLQVTQPPHVPRSDSALGPEASRSTKEEKSIASERQDVDPTQRKMSEESSSTQAREEKKSGFARFKESMARAVNSVKESIKAAEEERARKEEMRIRQAKLLAQEREAQLLRRQAQFVNLRLWLQDTDLILQPAMRYMRTTAPAAVTPPPQQQQQQQQSSSSFVSSFKSLFSRNNNARPATAPMPPPPPPPPGMIAKPIAVVLAPEVNEVIVLRPARVDVARVIGAAALAENPDSVFTQQALASSQQSDPIVDRIAPEVPTVPSQWPCQIVGRYPLHILDRITSAASDPCAVGIYWKSPQQGNPDPSAAPQTPEPLLLKFGTAEIASAFVANLKEAYLVCRARENERLAREAEAEAEQRALDPDATADLP